MPKNEAQNRPAASMVQRQERKKIRHGVIALVVLVLAVSGLAVLFRWLDHRFFERNARFTLRRIDIQSTGYWGRSNATRADLARFLNLAVGENNLFALSPAAIRGQLTSIPNIADAAVERVLPDTLEIRIQERVPRAWLGSTVSGLVVDANAKVMRSDQCFGVHNGLPLIVGLRGKVRVGTRLTEVQGALDFLMMVLRNMPEIQLQIISVSQPDRYTVGMKYRTRRSFQVILPRPVTAELLDEMNSALAETVRCNDSRSTINLLNGGSAVLQPAPGR